jgi:hypothetical protein
MRNRQDNAIRRDYNRHAERNLSCQTIKVVWKGEVVSQVETQRHQNEDRLFPLIKGGFRGLSFFLVDRRLQPPWSPFAKGENQLSPRTFHEIQLMRQPGFLATPK